MKAKVGQVRPEWETCCPDRPHADEVAMLRDHLDYAWGEITKLRDRISRESVNERRRADDFRAAAKKAAWDAVLFNMRIYVWNDAKRWAWELANAFLQDEPQGKKAFLERLERTRWNALQVKRIHDELDNPEAVPLVAELIRMRDAIRSAGERLHAEHGNNSGERCGCPGCEMSRAVYNSTLPEIEKEAS